MNKHALKSEGEIGSIDDHPYDELPELTDELEALGTWRDGEREVSRDEALAAMRKRLGRPRKDKPKHKVTLRLDQDVVAKLKADGPGWQTRANEALRAALALADEQ